MAIRVQHFVPNESDNLHCFQASFIMVVHALKGDLLSMADAELLTNFVPGRPTWPYKGLLSLADRGLFVRYTEEFPLDDFIADPAAAIRKHVEDDEIADQVIEVSDLPREIEFVRACREHPRISFDQRRPTLEDLKRMIESGALAIVNVNYWRLLEQDGYDGHFVVVEEVGPDTVRLQNPGLPPLADQNVPVEDFLAAWHYPNDRLANIISVSRSLLS